jgi:hypothetical protein
MLIVAIICRQHYTSYDIGNRIWNVAMLASKPMLYCPDAIHSQLCSHTFVYVGFLVWILLFATKSADDMCNVKTDLDVTFGRIHCSVVELLRNSPHLHITGTSDLHGHLTLASSSDVVWDVRHYRDITLFHVFDTERCLAVDIYVHVPLCNLVKLEQTTNIYYVIIFMSYVVKITSCRSRALHVQRNFIVARKFCIEENTLLF